MTIPEGWKLVPVEPTQKMVEAAFDALPNSPYEGRIRTHYRAMLSAAPTPPAQDDYPPRMKREDDCMTLQDWRIRAMNLEASWANCSQACARIQGQRDEALELLRQAAHALDEAADSIADWASYASDYFREKHDYEGDLKRTRDAAAHFRALIAKRGAA